MHQLAAALSGLRATNCHVGGFNPVVDCAVIPLAMAGMRIAPVRLGLPLGRLLHRGRVRSTRPLQLLDGTARRSGAHTQAMLVEPTRSFASQAAVGITVEWLAGSESSPG